MSKGSEACKSFLKWALPNMEMRWEGYKKVHGQVCTRINKRMKELGLDGYDNYKDYLQRHREEWEKLDEITHITISRFFRDKNQWKVLQYKILPELVEQAYLKSKYFRVWSAGCASGEEAYSFAILWKENIAPDHPDLQLEIIATDTDSTMLERAIEAKYTHSSIKEIPKEWKKLAFENYDNLFQLKNKYQKMVHFHKQDIREKMPEGPFDIVFCKNLIAMYFSKKLAIKLFQYISNEMRNGAWLFLGNHEEFPLEEVKEIKEYNKGLNLYKKV